MLAIVQYEVYAYSKGRWTLHARYPSEDKEEAILDARTTEAATGFPTKVLRETYYPELNNSETVTAYISPKAKDAQQKLSAAKNRATPVNPAQAYAGPQGRRAKATGRPRLTAMQMFFRILVAGGMSLAAATLITGVMTWAMSWVADAGNVIISSDARTTVLTYSYVLMFLYIFWSLYRSRLPLHRYLSDLWQKAAAQAQPVAEVPVVDGKPPRVKPKHDRPPSPEVLREWEEVKVARGDLDANQPPELSQALPPLGAVAPPAEAVLPPKLPDQPAPPQKAAEKTAIEKAATPAEAPPSLEPEKPAETKKKAAEKEREKEKEKAKAEVKATAEAKASLEELNLERMVLRRFAVDVVKPAIKATMPDDPVARRGAAVLLAGGAAGVAATARVGANAEMALLNDALLHIGMNTAAIDTFMSQHTQLVSAPANSGLLAAGRQALAAYLEGASDIAGSLARALTVWRTPMNQNQIATEVAFGAAETLPLIDVYMMTELREDSRDGATETAMDAFHDSAMGAHNNAVRHALAVHGGQEVKHTGKGIFARFTTATAAVDAAMDIQRGYQDDGSKLAIGIVGNSVAGEDPILSANLVRQAQAILARTGPGEILCEAQVRAAVKRQQREGDPNPKQEVEDLDLVRLVIPEPSFETPAIEADAAVPRPDRLH